MRRAATAALVVARLLVPPATLAHPIVARPHPPLAVTGPMPASSIPVGPVGGRIFDVGTSLPSGDSNTVTGLAVDSVTGTVYAANEFAGSVTAFNESTGAIEQSRTLAVFAAGSFPAGLLLDPAHHQLFVSVSTRFNIPSGAGWVLVLNESTLVTEQNISLIGSPAPPFEPTYLAYDAPTDQLFVENSTAGLVAAIDLASSRVAAFLACPVTDCAEHGYGLLDLPQFHTLVVPTCSYALWLVNVSNDTTRALLAGPSGAALMAWTAFDSADQLLWVENYSYFGAIGSFLGYNVSSLALVADVPGAPPRETGMSYDPINNLLVTTNINGSHEIATYRGSNASLVAASGTNGSTSDPFLTLTLDPVTHRALAGGPGNWSTVAYQLPSLALDQVYPSFPASQNAVTTDASRGTYLIASSSPDAVRAESESNGSRVWQTGLPFSSTPIGITLDPGTDRVFVADASSGSLLTFDAGTGAALASIALGVPSGAVCGVLDDPYLGLIFVGATQPAEILAVQVASGQVVGTFGMAGQLPCRLALDPTDEDLVVLSTAATGTLTDLRPSASGGFTPRSVEGVGPSPVDLAIDATGAVYILSGSGVGLDRYDNASSGLSAALVLNSTPCGVLTIDLTDDLLFLGSIHTGAILIVPAASDTLAGQFDDAAIVGALAFDGTSEVLVAATAATGQVLLASAVPVPSAPTGLSATPGNNSISLGWSAPLTSGPDPVTGYFIALQAPGANATGRSVSVSTLTQTFVNLTNGLAYDVSVAGVSAAGVGTSRATATAIPAGVPYPPTQLALQPQRNDGLAVNWSPPASDDGSPITDYQVHYAPTAGGPTSTIDAGPVLATVLAGLVPGVNYTVYVTANNSVGVSHPSAPRQVTIPLVTGAMGSPLLWGIALVVVGLAAVVALWAVARRRRRRRSSSDPGMNEGPLPASPELEDSSRTEEPPR